MIAIAIVAVIAVIGLTGLSRVIDGAESARVRVGRWQEIQLAMRLVAQDLVQVHPRSTRDELGDQYKGSLVASPLEPYDLEFSRGGWANPVGLPRGTVLRVAYNLEGDELVRYYWPVTDRTFGTTPFRRVLLDRIERFDMTFIDYQGETHLDWPPLNAAQQGPNSGNLTLPPRAVRIAVQLEDFGSLWRLVEVGG
jgi:general secretion pathway protein J